jgi:lysophospholipase L1-like esterase
MRRALVFAIAVLGSALVLVPAAGAARTRTCPPRSAHVTAGHATFVSLHCRRARGARIAVVSGPRHGTVGRVQQRRDRVRYRAPRDFTGTDRFRVRYRKGRHRWTALVSVHVRPRPSDGRPAPSGPAPVPAPPAPVPPAPVPPAPSGPASGPPPTTCAGLDVSVHYMAPETLTVTCYGQGLSPVQLLGEPAHGTLSDVRTGGPPFARTLTATYTPAAGYVGADSVALAISGAAGSSAWTLRLAVQPWRFWAIGDSVTAGFGFFGDGSPMTTLGQLLACRPGDVLSDRCSSNTDSAENYVGPVVYRADYGLANGVSWAAQFANGLQGGGHLSAAAGTYKNLAVTGSAPSDWLPGGLQYPQLQQVMAVDPDLVAMTIGANPLLSDILETSSGHACQAQTATVALFRACIQQIFDSAGLVPDVQRLWTTLLAGTRHAHVIAFEYHTPVPWFTSFTAEQDEQIVGLFNENLQRAYDQTLAAVPAAQAARLTLIQASRSPTDSDPLKLPWFTIGLPPQPWDTWTGTYDCTGGGGANGVDGPSHQSADTQTHLADPGVFCQGTAGQEWVISADTGIHPSRLGYTQFVTALANVAAAQNLVPPLP